MQPTETVWTIFVGDQPLVLPVKFGKIQWAVSVEKMFKEQYWRTTTDDQQRPVTIAHPELFVLRWAKNVQCSVCNK